jgi:WD40 repeat protein
LSIIRKLAQKILSATDSGMLFIWDPETGKTLHKINLNEGKYAFRAQQDQSGINSLVVNQANTICVLGGIANGGVRLVNLKMGKVVAALDEHESHATVEVEIFEPEGLGVPLLISAGTDGTAFFYDAASFKLRNSIRHQVSNMNLRINRASFFHTQETKLMLQ